MSIQGHLDFEGMKLVSEAVAQTLKAMVKFAAPGMSTKELDELGGKMLASFGAKSAPKETYRFPGYTCISIRNQFCHGIPTSHTILQEGDLVNIDVSAELNGYWADNGASFVLGEDIHGHQPLVEASKEILKAAIDQIQHGVKISDVGHIMETEANKRGYKVIRNLAGHGVGRSLHEAPREILNYRDRYNRRRFKRNSVVAIETFISTHSELAITESDGWTMVGNKGGFMTQHEHTLMVTDDKPHIFTMDNGIWD
ncbi:type I methionyl aminopeptidase [Pontibacter sp. G13]|uniref:type I methionyl aminopeptidase n=1 Tax=Pontibacter sp. G13 TaxID=3074898 RepID=UPI00288AEC15|nr:type I methionyl aminopeptidase [Pontibacter sp. G13]WNJ18337.1 type I methionyl aminopeptidase [Pontibacter sp. G13]